MWSVLRRNNPVSAGRIDRTLFRTRNLLFPQWLRIVGARTAKSTSSGRAFPGEGASTNNYWENVSSRSEISTGARFRRPLRFLVLVANSARCFSRARVGLARQIIDFPYHVIACVRLGQEVTVIGGFVLRRLGAG